MDHLVFLTPPDAEYGFGLAGFRQQCVAVAGAEAALRVLLAEAGPRLVVIDERLLAGIDPEHFAELERRYGGALTVLPAPGPAAGGAAYAERLIARAIGYQLRLDAEAQR